MLWMNGPDVVVVVQHERVIYTTPTCLSDRQAPPLPHIVWGAVPGEDIFPVPIRIFRSTTQPGSVLVLFAILLPVTRVVFDGLDCCLVCCWC